jgi:hypothetical protein
MLATVVGLTLAAAPLVAILGLLWLAARLRRTAAQAAARQIALTNAVHRELGAVVSPTVSKRALGPWRVLIPVPFRQPEVLGRVVSIVHATFAGLDHGGASGVQIVLTPQREPAQRRWAA